MTRVHVAVPVRWSDLDEQGHVNNARMVTLLEEARIAAFWAGSPDAPPTAVMEAGGTAPLVTVVAGHQIEYRRPIPHHREPLDVELWLGRLGGASLQVCYEVYSPIGQHPRVLYTRAVTTIVLVDRDSGEPRRLPDPARAAWQPYVEAPLQLRT